MTRCIRGRSYLAKLSCCTACSCFWNPVTSRIFSIFQTFSSLRIRDVLINFEGINNIREQPKMTMMRARYHWLVVFCILCCLCFLLQRTRGSFDTNAGGYLQQELGGNHQIHCSRERSRAAWKIIQEYLMPVVEKENYHISRRCKLHPDNNLYRDQEQHKFHIDINEWQCGYCKKIFYEEKHIDQHFDNRHSNLLNLTHTQCLADVCGAVHCDLEINSGSKKSKCNPAAAARNKHLCESLADSCFPVNDGPAASRLHEFFLHQFCDAHSCTGSKKPFSRGRKKKSNVFYIVASVLLVMLLLLYYIYIYLYQRGMKRETQVLKRLSQTSRKKKPS